MYPPSTQCGRRISSNATFVETLPRLPVEQPFPSVVIVFLHGVFVHIRIEPPVGTFEQVLAKKIRAREAPVLRASEQAEAVMGKRDIRPANLPCATPGRTSRHARLPPLRNEVSRVRAGPAWRKTAGTPFLGERDHRRVGHEGLGERRERARVVRVHLERTHRGPVAAAVLDHEAHQAGRSSRETALFAETMRSITLAAPPAVRRVTEAIFKTLRHPLG